MAWPSKTSRPAWSKAVFRRPWPASRSTRALHGPAITDDVTRLSLPVGTPASATEAADFPRHRPMASASDGRCAPIQEARSKNHRVIQPISTPRATSSTTRKNQVQSPSRTCPRPAAPRSLPATMVQQASPVACHKMDFLGRFRSARSALARRQHCCSNNAPFPPEEVAMRLPAVRWRQAIRAKQLAVGKAKSRHGKCAP